MNAAAKRGLDLLAYTISGLALAGAVVYGVQRLTAAPPAPAPPPLPEAAPAPAAETAPPAAPPTEAAVVTAPPEALPPSPPPASAQPVVSAQDKAAFFALQRNCYEAADNNRSGEYPALEAAACNRYSQFANEHGWNPGALPGYGQPAPPTQPAQDYAEAVPAEPQVILVQQPDYYQHHRNAVAPHHEQRPPPQQTTPAPPAGVAMPIHRPVPGNGGRPPPTH